MPETDKPATFAQLEEACAVLIDENNRLRANAGRTRLSEGRITFDHEALQRGRSLCPKAFINAGGCLVVKLEQ